MIAVGTVLIKQVVDLKWINHLFPFRQATALKGELMPNSKFFDNHVVICKTNAKDIILSVYLWEAYKKRKLMLTN